MKICHYNHLEKTGTFRHKCGEMHERYFCEKCGERYQYSPTSGWYQIRSKSGADPRRNRSFRNTDAQRAEMIADAGSVQGWVDKWYRIMKETPR